MPRADASPIGHAHAGVGKIYQLKVTLMHGNHPVVPIYRVLLPGGRVARGGSDHDGHEGGGGLEPAARTSALD